MIPPLFIHDSFALRMKKLSRSPSHKMSRTLLSASIAVTLLGCASQAWAANDLLSEWGEGTEMRWLFSPYTYHYVYDSAHKPVVMVGLEREHQDAKVDGVAFFSNSFGQPTVYLYPWGHVYKDVGGVNNLSMKWTAGLLYGYRGEYADKVPFNHNGLSPAVIPAVAYEFDSGWAVQANILGTAGLMFQVSKPLR
jgi:hypothetical protein